MEAAPVCSPHSQGVDLAAVDQSISIGQMIAGWIMEAQWFWIFQILPVNGAKQHE